MLYAVQRLRVVVDVKIISLATKTRLALCRLNTNVNRPWRRGHLLETRPSTLTNRAMSELGWRGNLSDQFMSSKDPHQRPESAVVAAPGSSLNCPGAESGSKGPITSLNVGRNLVDPKCPCNHAIHRGGSGAMILPLFRFRPSKIKTN